MAETNIYSIEGELRWWFSACMPLWTERIDAQYTYHKWKLGVIFFQLPAHNNQPLDYPTQSEWGDICLNYIMSGRYDKVHFCNVAEQITLHTTINLTPTLSVRWDEMRDRWWITEIKFVPWIMIMTEHHRSIVYFYRSMYVGWRKV